MIKIENITKKFGDRIIFDNFSLSIEQGESVAIMGESGTGKSTLLNIIGLLDVDYKGKYYILGKDQKNKSWSKRSETIRNNINYLFQNYALVEDETVRNNLLYALYYTKLSVKEKQAIISRTLSEFGLLEHIDKQVYKLSGGEQQRVSLARSVIKTGNLILADEPTGNLDEKNKKIVMEIINEINRKGKTVIIVTHDIEVANQCSRIIYLQ